MGTGLARQNSSAWRSIASGLMLASALSGSCSLMLDADQKQCRADADCGARGLARSVCVANVCQPLSAASSSSGTSGTAATTTTAPPDTGSEPPAAGASTGAAGPTPPTRDTAGNPASVGPAGGGASIVTASAGTGAAAGPAGTGSVTTTAGAGGGAGSSSCTGTNCPECSVNEDCERRGMIGGVCADATCWAPKPECSADQDCVSLGPEYMGGRCISSQCRPNPRWRCEAPPAPPSPTEMKELKVLVRDSISIGAIADVRIVACQKLDVTCTKPVTEGKTGKDGYLHITLPANFAGYLQQTDRTDYAPAMYFLPAVFPASGELQPFPLLASGVIIDALALALGAGIDAKRGNMMLIAEDCFGDALAGVTFSSPQKDASTVQFYVADVLPSPDAKETAAAGNGGYLNFPAGTAMLTVKQVQTNLELATVSIVVRAGFISVAYIRPQLR